MSFILKTINGSIRFESERSSAREERVTADEQGKGGCMMGSEREQILKMLEEGKITAERGDETPRHARARGACRAQPQEQVHPHQGHQ